ncbi:MAG: hypothetical protein KL839_03965 [Rhizobium sp.]|nr:hypothetical protein [Rhizobium sp.]
MKSNSSRSILAVITAVVFAPSAGAEPAEGIRITARALAHCAGHLAAVGPYAESVADLDRSTSMNAEVLVPAAEAVGVNEAALRKVVDAASVSMRQQLITKPMDARQRAAQVQSHCNEIAMEAHRLLKPNKSNSRPAKPEGGSTQPSLEKVAAATSTEATRTPEERPAAVVEKPQNIEAAPSEESGADNLSPDAIREVANTASATVGGQDETVIADNADASALSEFETWKVEARRKAEEKARQEQVAAEEQRVREQRRIEEMKPILEVNRRKHLAREELSKARHEVNHERKGDDIFHLWGEISDINSKDIRDSCYFTPKAALSLLSLYRTDPANFRQAAVLELTNWEKYLTDEPAYKFVSDYVVDTLAGSDQVLRERLIEAIDGKTISLMCILNYVAPIGVERTNKRLANLNQGDFEEISIDLSEPFYGFLCAQIASKNKDSIMQGHMMDRAFANNALAFAPLYPNLTDFFTFSQQKVENKDETFWRSILSNEWNRQCVAIASGR